MQRLLLNKIIDDLVPAFGAELHLLCSLTWPLFFQVGTCFGLLGHGHMTVPYLGVSLLLTFVFVLWSLPFIGLSSAIQHLFHTCSLPDAGRGVLDDLLDR